MSPAAKPSIGWNILLYTLACAPLVVLLIICVIDAYFDVQMIEKTTLRAEISRLRSQAVRRAERLEFVLGLEPTTAEWETLRQDPWLQGEWESIGTPSAHELYAAIIDPAGRIVLHSNPEYVGRTLGRGWYVKTVPEAGDDVVRLEKSSLANRAAYDVRVPLEISGSEVGEYHEGLDAAWFDREVAALQRDALRSRMWVLALAAAVNVAAGYALYRIASRHWRLSRAVDAGARDRAVHLAQIASGLAHEIRNPLHALRLNLHALGKSLAGKTRLSQEELLEVVQESDLEINQLDSLLRDLIRFAAPDAAKKIELNVVSEVQATLNLLQEDMRHKDIEVRSRWEPQPVLVWFDPSRLRQMLVNLLTFAQNNAGSKGHIDVEVNRRGNQAELVVADSGPPLSNSQIERIFEPFQAPCETGTGLGLALVQSFAAEAGGSATCEANGHGGNRFRVLLPNSTPRRRI